MESNSKPGCIHVSQATADELIRWGKGAWLKEREDRVHAKGKGEMITYWVNVPREGSVKSMLTGNTELSFVERNSDSGTSPAVAPGIVTPRSVTKPSLQTPVHKPPSNNPIATGGNKWVQIIADFEDEVEI
jgi:Adenylate and Guanylate cyclase catalytic domain